MENKEQNNVEIDWGLSSDEFIEYLEKDKRKEVWGSLTPEEIDDAIQLGFDKPYDSDDFRRFLIDHGYNPDNFKYEEQEKNTKGKVDIDWGPLTPEEIDDAIQLGFDRPYDSDDFRRFLIDHGYNPDNFKYEEQEKNAKGKVDIDWGPLTPEEIDDAIQLGFDRPYDSDDYNRFLINHGYDPNKIFGRNGRNLEQKENGEVQTPHPSRNEIKKEIPNSVTSEKESSKALQPLYWEVYNKVATERCSSPARALYKASQTVIFPWNQNMSTPEKALSVVGTLYRAPLKLIGFLGTKITRTDKKFARMKEAVDNLTPEEFSILMDTPEESARKFGHEVKSSMDEFLLTSDTMRQYKHNTLALDAIGTRLKTETDITISVIEQKKAEFERISQEIIAQMEQATPDQRTTLNKVLQQCNEQISALNAESKRVVEKSDSFFNGVEHRTAKYKDTEGWILGKFNPDNRTANQEMQRLQESYRNAMLSSDPSAVKAARDAIQNFGTSQTRVITVGDNIHNRINRGLYSVDRVQTQNMTPQTIGKQILANIATIGCLEKVFTDIVNNQVKDYAIQSNNFRIGIGNRANKNIPYSQQGTTQVDMHDYLDIESAEQGVKNINIIAGHEVGEHGNFDMSANLTNGSWSGGLNTAGYIARDNANHARSAAEVANGTLESSFDYLKSNISMYKSAMEEYAKSHPFDYSFMKAMDISSIDSVQKLFHDLTVPINVTFDVSGAVTGMQIAEMGDIAYKTMTPALMATMLASQAGHMTSNAKADKAKKKEEKRRKKENRVQKEAKREKKQAQKQTGNEIGDEGETIEV